MLGPWELAGTFRPLCKINQPVTLVPPADKHAKVRMLKFPTHERFTLSQFSQIQRKSSAYIIKQNKTNKEPPP